MEITWKNIPDHAWLMTIDDFRADVKSGAYTDENGKGYYANKEKMSSERVFYSDIDKKPVGTIFTHVAWFNK